MPQVLGVRFKPVTKIYYFLPPDGHPLKSGDPVIVETSRGTELGWVAMEATEISGGEVKGSLKTILRRATPVDLMKMNDYQQQKAMAIEKCKAKVTELGLPMKIVDAEYAFDGSRILFSFSSEQRVDFRDLVRAMVRSLRTRVEMRQIGARDEAKIINGYGRCGRQLCCSSWLTEFHPVSIRMAKNQQLPLAPTEISGLCGRLLCCLAYEDELYTEIRKTLPKVGSTMETKEGMGVVKGLNILKETVIVEVEGSGTRLEIAIHDNTGPAEEPAVQEEQPEPELKAPPAKSQKQRKARSKTKKRKNQPDQKT